MTASVVAAQAELARAVAQALEQYAGRLDALDEDADLDLRTTDEVPAPEDEYNLGKRQRQVVSLRGLATEAGLRTSEIATAIAYEVPNTYTTLQALARSDIVEMVPNVEPQHWRLARRYRPNSDAFIRIAGHVHRGEWTTYGDISLVVLGDHRASRGVGRAVAQLPEFPNPHRVLLQGGIVNPEWEDDAGNGPDECRRRLADEGIAFDPGGHADPARRVTWDILMARDAAESLAG